MEFLPISIVYIKISRTIYPSWRPIRPTPAPLPRLLTVESPRQNWNCSQNNSHLWTELLPPVNTLDYQMACKRCHYFTEEELQFLNLSLSLWIHPALKLSLLSFFIEAFYILSFLDPLSCIHPSYFYLFPCSTSLQEPNSHQQNWCEYYQDYCFYFIIFLFNIIASLMCWLK